MSGSIGGKRIRREEVQPTLDKYIERVLSKMPGFVSAQITGSYNAGTRKDHGDIDLAVHIKGTNVTQVKKAFKAHLDSLDLPEFVTGKNQGKKSQLYGAIVTCGFPISGREEDYVQIDNIIVTNENEQRFQRQFLDLDAAKQGLVMGYMRTILHHKDADKVLEYIGLTDLPKPSGNQEYEFVLSSAGLSFRLVTLNSDMRETAREELWRSANWDLVEYILSPLDLSKSYEELLDQVAKIVKNDNRSKRRIVGIMKSMIKVGPGEVGTPKGDGKIAAIEKAETILKEGKKMTSLFNYLVESLPIQHFITEYKSENGGEDIESYFANVLDDGKIYVLGRGKKKDVYITLNDLKYVYEYAKEHGMPCPVIVDYKGVAGNFVFRRWVGRLNSEPHVFEHLDLNTQKGKPYMGLHNTNMKEDGHWFPTAEDMESIIAFAYNKRCGIFDSDVDNIIYVTGKKAETNSKSQQLMEYYVGNREDIDPIIDVMISVLGEGKTEKDAFKKLESGSPVRSEWISMGEFNERSARVNKTPKTDIHTASGKRLSLKKAGGAQLMSGFECESLATMLFAAIETEGKDSELISEIKSLFDNYDWGRGINVKDAEKRGSQKTTNGEMNKVFTQICKEHPDFFRALCYEATTGEKKFGKDSRNVPNMVLEWSEEGKSSIYKIDDYISHKNWQPVIGFKTVNDKTSTSLRIL